MHQFIERNGELCCEGVGLSDLARRHGTPLFVYSRATLLDHLRKLQKALQPLRPLICFSVKSNSNLSLLRLLVRHGAGLDVVSGGELYRARKAGADPRRVVYASVGKTEEEIAHALRWGILFFNVESLQEVCLISEVAARLKKTANICVRVNPNIDPHTHRYITTGTIESKFGVDFATARLIFLNRDNFKNVRVMGLHVHIGSQITQSKPFLAALRRTLELIAHLRSLGVEVSWLNVGGGLGIIYRREKPQTAQEYARAVVPLLRRAGVRIIFEPGRFIVGNAGVLVTRVLYTKETPSKRFVVVDAGMNDLMRPSLYEAYHEVRAVAAGNAGTQVKKTDIVGPICESGDFLVRDRMLPAYGPGNLLAVMGAGAYGMSMSSNYNSRRRAAEVLVAGKEAHLIRRRETYADLVRPECVIEAR
ncbi:MAG: diaminopimelate decarboxylase [Deltaproteobacteria bacterium]